VRRFIAAAVAWTVTALLAILSPYAGYVNEDFLGFVLLILMFSIIFSGAVACKYTITD
jgi:hypothetical protein